MIGLYFGCVFKVRTSHDDRMFSVSPGQQVAGDYNHKIVIKEDGTQSLIISPAVPLDSGEWTVIAQNRAGRSSTSVTLSVDGETAAHELCRRATSGHFMTFQVSVFLSS